MPDIISDQIPMDIPKEHRWPVRLWFHFTSINQLRQTGVFVLVYLHCLMGFTSGLTLGWGLLLSSKLEFTSLHTSLMTGVT